MTDDRDEDREASAPSARTDLPEPPRDTSAAFRLRPEAAPRHAAVAARPRDAGGRVSGGVGRRARVRAPGLAPQGPERRALRHRSPDDRRRPNAPSGRLWAGCRARFRSWDRRFRAIWVARCSPPARRRRPWRRARGSSPDPARQQAQQRRQRVAQELDAARTSRLFASEARTAQPGADPAAPSLGLPGMGTPGGDASHPTQPTASDRKLAFLNGAVDRNTVSAERLAAPASPYTLQAGAVIAAAMITGLRSDLPGQDRSAGHRERL